MRKLRVAYMLPHHNITGGMKCLVEHIRLLRSRGHRTIAVHRRAVASTPATVASHEQILLLSLSHCWSVLPIQRRHQWSPRSYDVVTVDVARYQLHCLARHEVMPEKVHSSPNNNAPSVFCNAERTVVSVALALAFVELLHFMPAMLHEHSQCAGVSAAERAMLL
jgi:hypothetical protein